MKSLVKVTEKLPEKQLNNNLQTSTDRQVAEKIIRVHLLADNTVGKESLKEMVNTMQRLYGHIPKEHFDKALDYALKQKQYGSHLNIHIINSFATYESENKHRWEKYNAYAW